MKLIFATTNSGKLAEATRVAERCGVTIIAPPTTIALNVAEIGLSYEENSSIKALHAMNLLKSSVIADDTGLEIEGLGNLPGLYTARWGLERLYDYLYPGIEYKAKFVCSLCFAEARKSAVPRMVFCKAGICGSFVLPPVRNQQQNSALPFSYHFFPSDNKSCSISERVKNDLSFLSHRGLAFKTLFKLLEKD